MGPETLNDVWPGFQGQHHVPAWISNPLHLCKTCCPIRVATVGVDPGKTQPAEKEQRYIEGCWILKTKIYWGRFVAQRQLRMWNWKILSWNGPSSNLLGMLMYKFDNLHGFSIFASHPSSFVATVNLCAIMNLMKRINSIISDKYCPIKQKIDKTKRNLEKERPGFPFWRSTVC